MDISGPSVAPVISRPSNPVWCQVACSPRVNCAHLTNDFEHAYAGVGQKLLAVGIVDSCLLSPSNSNMCMVSYSSLPRNTTVLKSMPPLNLDVGNIPPPHTTRATDVRKREMKRKCVWFALEEKPSVYEASFGRMESIPSLSVDPPRGARISLLAEKARGANAKLPTCARKKGTSTTIVVTRGVCRH